MTDTIQPPSERARHIGYADPPYPGCSHLYKGHPDYAGEVDYPALINRLEQEYDGWVLHSSATPQAIALIASHVERAGARWMAWVKPFAAFKRNVPVAYAWEPVIIKAVRKPAVNHRVVMRDWFSESITLKKGLTGVKPERLCHWAFEMLGAEPADFLYDLFPGTGAVTRAWESWRQQLSLDLAEND